jgi:hypothetical protein
MLHALLEVRSRVRKRKKITGSLRIPNIRHGIELSLKGEEPIRDLATYLRRQVIAPSSGLAAITQCYQFCPWNEEVGIDCKGPKERRVSRVTQSGDLLSPALVPPCILQYIHVPS